MNNAIVQRFRSLAPKVDYCSLRIVRDRSESLSVRRDVLEPLTLSENSGAMVTVIHKGGMGYAATSDLSERGLQIALDSAKAWAERTAKHSACDYSKIAFEARTGEYQTPVRSPWSETPLSTKRELLETLNQKLKQDDRIIDYEASLSHSDIETTLVTANGGCITQRTSQLIPFLSATANVGSETQTRTLGGRAYCRQGGLELLDTLALEAEATQIANEALELLYAPNCPSGSFDLLLAPDQMILQIHESIGHPLELDRILGDERNYAGTSFVTLDMFGKYVYGSDLLNVTYDPTRPEQFASFAFDDEGTQARKVFLIEKGILKHPLGGIVSQARGGLGGVATARACAWNRPPIDRMSNLNIEPGTSTFDEMVRATERGVYMKTNSSWSIDDSRNKFQFGCEWARLIENGKLGPVVKNPCYRGISSTFWRSLKAVGDLSTFEVLGTPFCGKGEPNQMVRVGHATPSCLFADVSVFGGG